MVGQGKRSLKVFLCHASGDKPIVRQLYKRLVMEGLDAWLDQEKLLPGQDWRLEIPKAVREADVVVICLSNRSITKEGYIQKEIKFALDIAEEKPEGTIFVIPARLEDCPVPERLNRWQWVDLFEENGYVRLLRSLKIRADKTGAVIEPLSYDDKEHEKRIEQLYTEGLAAFWVEDWDKACHRFQTILSEQPNHQGAIEKLEEAERQRNFAKLYSRAVEAQNNQDWQLVISTLENLLKKVSSYKDADAMLTIARKEQQLKTLYAEAKTLHAAQKWEAVLRVFEQISSIEPNYADPDSLLASAQIEVDELERLAKLNELYSNAIHKLDSGEWYKARTLLEQVHKSETGFLETERLLRKVEDEIHRHEEQQWRQDQINTLYEQARGLLRSNKWRKALEKIEEIRTLDGQFDDPENIAEQAQKEIELEEQEAERQNELAALYTEAVRLVREEKYQEALEKLQEVKSIDPKYPDRQKVQRTARKSLVALSKPAKEKRIVTLPKSLWMGVGGIVIITIIILVLNFSGKIGEEPASSVIVVPTVNWGGTAVMHTHMMTNSPGQPTATQATSGYSDPTLYDDFDDPPDGLYDSSLWSPLWNANYATVRKKAGQLSFTVNDTHQYRLVAEEYKDFFITKSFFMEAELFIDPATTGDFTHLIFGFDAIHKVTGDDYGTACGIFSENEIQSIQCGNFEYQKNSDPVLVLDNTSPDWHTFRIEITPPGVIRYFVDGIPETEYTFSQPDEFENLQFYVNLGMNMYGDSATGYFDNVRMGAIEDDPSATNAPEQSICASIQECQQLAEKAVESNDPESALDYFNLAINMVPSNLKPQYSGLWHDRADIQEQLHHLDEAQKDRDIWWLYDLDVQKIVFHSNRDGNDEIYAMDVAGEKVVRLTFDPSRDWGGVWSPDGSTIVFTSDRSGNDDIYIMDLDGSNVRNLTNNPASDALPSWSPDGSKIAYYSDRSWNGDIYVMNADGTNFTCIVKDDAGDWGPAWSPDGSKIAYSTDAYGDHAAVVMVNSDGSDFQDLSNHAAGDSSPSWSPDGKKITFTSKRRYDETMIYILDLESNKVELLVDAHGWGSKWSPDGNQIVFTSYNDLHDNEIALFDFQTQNLVFLTDNDANDERPSWSPLP